MHARGSQKLFIQNCSLFHCVRSRKLDVLNLFQDFQLHELTQSPGARFYVIMLGFFFFSQLCPFQWSSALCAFHLSCLWPKSVIRIIIFSFWLQSIFFYESCFVFCPSLLLSPSSPSDCSLNSLSVSMLPIAVGVIVLK